jgi:hypothetical protein
MKKELLNELLAAHDKCVTWEGMTPKFELVTFDAADM